MAFVVKNPGMIPGRQVILAGEIRKEREEMAEMFEGCWRSCVEAGNGVDDNEQNFRPFIANANPPSFAHIPLCRKIEGALTPDVCVSLDHPRSSLLTFSVMP